MGRVSKERREEYKEFKEALLAMLPDDLLVWKKFASQHSMQAVLQLMYKHMRDKKVFRSIWTEDKVYTIRIR